MFPLTLLRLLRFCKTRVLVLPITFRTSSIVTVPRIAPFVSGPSSNFGLFQTCRVRGTPGDDEGTAHVKVSFHAGLFVAFFTDDTRTCPLQFKCTTGSEKPLSCLPIKPAQPMRVTSMVLDMSTTQQRLVLWGKGAFLSAALLRRLLSQCGGGEGGGEGGEFAIASRTLPIVTNAHSN